MARSPEKSKKYEERLADAFAFDEVDLEANRSGKLTPRQMHRLNKARSRAVTLWAVPTIIAVMGMLIWLVLSPASLGAIERLIVFALGALVVAGAYFFAGLQSRRLEADMRDPQISTVEGPVELIVGGAQYGVTYMMKVGGKQFLLKKDTFFALKNGDPYCVYYTARSKQLLSVEWLRDGDETLIDEGGAEAEETPLDAEVKPKHQL
jgi:hypothetical protein